LVGVDTPRPARLNSHVSTCHAFAPHRLRRRLALRKEDETQLVRGRRIYRRDRLSRDFAKGRSARCHAGAVASFNYSEANKNSGLVWNEATFKDYIRSPQAKIPGTKMAFAGITNPQEIDDLWAYLKQFEANGDIKK
jgi:hypothetical protein